MTTILYAMPGSLYSCKARAYMRHFRVPHEERGPGHPRYGEAILPAIGRFIIPVIETEEGAIIQDSTDIIDHFQAACPEHPRLIPASPRLAAIAHLFALYGAEGMLRPAMHFRWNFDDTNLAFLRRDFSGSLQPGGDQAAQDGAFAMASGRMRQAALALGVTPAAIPAIEASYRAFLGLFDAHLAAQPFLLGGRISAGDLGLFAPLYAHLARDPYPSLMMKQIAWRVWRWVERVNGADGDLGDYLDPSDDFLPGDEVPSTLRDLMRFVAEDFRDVMLAEVAVVDTAAASGETGAPCARGRIAGNFDITWRGVAQTLGAFPYRVYLLQRLQDCVAAMAPDDRAAVHALFEETGLAPLLGARSRRPVRRVGNREVWGERT